MDVNGVIFLSMHPSTDVPICAAVHEPRLLLLMRDQNTASNLVISATVMYIFILIDD